VPKIKLVILELKRIDFIFRYSYPLTDTAAMALLRRLAVGEICLLQDVQENYPFAVLDVDCITVGPHRWCILHDEKDDVFSKGLVQTDAFTEAENLQVCLGLLLCVLVYMGRNNDCKLT